MDQEPLPPITSPTMPLPPQPEVAPVPPAPRNSKPLLILVILVLLLAVGVGGLILGKSLNTSRLPAQPTVAPVPTQIPTLAVDETINWKAYTNKNLSFSYPDKWEVGTEQNFGSRLITEFTYQNTPLFTVSEIGNYNQLTGKPYSSLDEFLGSRKDKAKSTTVNNYPAKQITDPGDGGHVIPYQEIILFSRDKSFLISLYYSKDYYEATDDNKVFNLILSTFRFD